jgi:hypothetical protein
MRHDSLAEAAYEAQFLDVLFRRPRCGEVAASPHRHAGQPLAGRPVLTPAGPYLLGSPVEPADKPAMMVGKQALDGYPAETGRPSIGAPERDLPIGVLARAGHTGEGTPRHPPRSTPRGRPSWPRIPCTSPPTTSRRRTHCVRREHGDSSRHARWSYPRTGRWGAAQRPRGNRRHVRPLAQPSATARTHSLAQTHRVPAGRRKSALGR